MRELTQELPKPMLRVQGRPILEHIIDGLRAAGIREVCFVTGWRAEVIEDYFGDGSRWNLSIHYARQEVQDGTGRAPEYAKAFVGADDFLLTYGDILVRPDTYARMINRFRQGPFAGVITVTVGEDVTKGGINCFDPDFCLARLIEKPTPEQVRALREEGFLKEGAPLYYNAGIYIFRPLIYDFTARLVKSPRGEFELTDAISMLIAAGHRLAGLEIEGRWVDVRDPEVLAQLEQGKL
ncbi:MAG: nucleotidyltransferase family protein [Verrucomicrobiales bacterium]|nr:nucleotidyltransferase family protein [Verrucomicrobiales bacterium]